MPAPAWPSDKPVCQLQLLYVLNLAMMITQSMGTAGVGANDDGYCADDAHSAIAAFCCEFDLEAFTNQTRIAATLPPSNRESVVHSDEQQRVHNRDLTYGTLQAAGVQQLLRQVQLSARDIFYDLGSGAGGVTSAVFCDTSIAKAVGVELSKQRADLVPVPGGKLSSSVGVGGGRQLLFINANMLDVDLADATVIFTNSIVFADTTTRQLVAKLERELKEGALVLSTAILHRYGISRLRPSKRKFQPSPGAGSKRSYLDELMGRDTETGMVGSFAVDSSWGGSRIYVYEIHGGGSS